jgi:hypothetical protein
MKSREKESFLWFINKANGKRKKGNQWYTRRKVGSTRDFLSNINL